MIVLGIDAPGKYKGAFAVYASESRRLLDHSEFLFSTNESERHFYQSIRLLLDRITKRYKVELVVIEHPFLYLIAQFIGAIKMWVSGRRGIRWCMITSQQAHKAVFEKEEAVRKLKLKGKARKQFVRDWALIEFGLSGISQHEADAILYAVAGAPLFSRSGRNNNGGS